MRIDRNKRGGGIWQTQNCSRPVSVKQKEEKRSVNLKIECLFSNPGQNTTGLGAGVKATRSSDPLSHRIYTYLRRPNADMDTQNPFSRLKKKFQRLGNKRKPEKTGADPGGGRVDASGSHSQPADRQPVRSTDRTPQSEDPGSGLAHGGRSGQEGGEVGVDGEAIYRRSSQLHSDIGVAVESGPGQEGSKVDGENIGQGTRTCFSLAPVPNRSSDDVDISTVPDHIPGALCSDRGTGSNDDADENKSNWKSTVSTTAKLLLRGVRDSADAFGPLRSVAGGLCFILENYEVRQPSPHIILSQCLQVSQRANANKQAIESLAPRVKSLANTLCTPVPEGDAKEESRRKILGR